MLCVLYCHGLFRPPVPPCAMWHPQHVLSSELPKSSSGEAVSLFASAVFGRCGEGGQICGPKKFRKGRKARIVNLASEAGQADCLGSACYDASA